MDFVLGQQVFFGSSAATVFKAQNSIQERDETRNKQVVKSPPIKACAEEGKVLLDASSDVNSNASQSGVELSKFGADSYTNFTSSTPLPLPSSRSLFPSPLRFLWFSKHESDAERSLDSRNVAESFQSQEEEESALYQTQISNEVKEQLHLAKPNLPESDSAETVEGGAPRKTGWIENLLHFSSFRKGPSSHTPEQGCGQPYVCNDCTQRTLAELGDLQNVIVIGESNPDDSEQVSVSVSPHIESNTSQDHGCSLESSQECLANTAADTPSLEIPYTHIVHDRESFSQFLQAVTLGQLKLITKMAYLCNLAYKIRVIKPDELYQTYHFTYVTSSLDRKAESTAKDKASENPSPLAVSKPSSTENAEDHFENRGDEAKLSVTVSPATAYTLASEVARYVHSQTKSSLTDQPESANDAEKNGNKVLTGHGVAGNVKDEADGNVSLTPPNVEVDCFTHLSDMELNPNLINNSAEHILLNGPFIGSNNIQLKSSGLASCTALSAATALVGTPEQSKQVAVKDLQSLHTCPCEWFCCDDKEKHIRYFVIQGSESLASWQTNLLFEPIHFEDSALGVLVHRGIYEAAKGLFEQIVPEILEYLQTRGHQGHIQLTGHSLGGSLATLLSLMLQVRGVVASSSLLPVVTFGSPCVMCGGDYLLEKLGLPENHIQSIVMHRDIVPRTFACEYPQHVVEVLKRLNGTFRDHPCLMRQRLLYAPMGQYLLLQPDREQAPPHPFLPRGSGFYLLRNPGSSDCSLSDSKLFEQKVALRAAQRAFFNAPHPLQILSDPGAYGPDGSISRDHDARSYVKALSAVLRLELKRSRHIRREQRRHFWWPLVAAKLSSNEARSSVEDTNHAFSKDPSPSTISPQYKGPKPSLTGTSGQLQSPTSNIAWEACIQKHSSPQHLQMVLLGLFSARMLLIEGFATFFAWV
ncbi:hypothetical protein O6H91_21G014500 [Diphasiastrum complanatum]|uniref:Uncharacterized protein n=1 Tax=Diphasiastrum complanatum TaxID=34168 RepID=A0ACC2AI91_DIPCM|nr:hypothetical protein O6H91_21G014500 [Diphasiastrum complanatum]